MDFFLSLSSTIYDHFLIGLGIGFALFICRTLLIIFCRWYQGENTFLASITHHIKTFLISYYVYKINKIGLQALVYTPKYDGKKVSLKDAMDDIKIHYKDPLILEQDLKLINCIYNQHTHLIFYKMDDLSVKGYFHDLMSKKVYIGKIKEIKE